MARWCIYVVALANIILGCIILYRKPSPFGRDTYRKALTKRTKMR